MPPLEQQGINILAGPWEGTEVLPSLCGHIKPCLLLFTEQMGQDVSAESSSCTHQGNCSLLCLLCFAGTVQAGCFQVALLYKSGLGSPCPSNKQENLNLPLLEIMILLLILNFN